MSSLPTMAVLEGVCLITISTRLQTAGVHSPDDDQQRRSSGRQHLAYSHARRARTAHAPGAQTRLQVVTSGCGCTCPPAMLLLFCQVEVSAYHPFYFARRCRVTPSCNASMLH